MKNLFSLAFLLALAGSALAQDFEAVRNLILQQAKVQGTVTGKDIIPSAIVDDLILRPGNTFLVDAKTGRLLAKLSDIEQTQHPVELQVKVVEIAHKCVILKHLDTNLVLSLE